MNLNIKICKICGLCYGAKRAVDLTTEILKNKTRVVLFKQLLHNKYTVDRLLQLGAVQKNSLDEITKEDFVIIRSHGEPKKIYEYLNCNGISYLDCTCPNVLKIIEIVKNKSAEGYKIIILGKYGYKTKIMHPEVNAISGWCNNPILIESEEEIKNIEFNFEKYFLVIQTTFSKEKALAIIEKIKLKLKLEKKTFEFFDTTCPAQLLIKEQSVKLAENVNLMLVVGDKNSSNTIELFNLLSLKVKTFFIESLEDLKELIAKREIIDGFSVGMTAGASTSLEEVYEYKEFLKNV